MRVNIVIRSHKVKKSFLAKEKMAKVTPILMKASLDQNEPKNDCLIHRKTWFQERYACDNEIGMNKLQDKMESAYRHHETAVVKFQHNVLLNLDSWGSAMFILLDPKDNIQYN